MLLAPAWLRLLAAGAAVALIWTVVLLALPSTPSIAPEQPAVRVAAPQPVASAAPVMLEGELRAVVTSGMTAPGGGRFDRFDVAGQPVVAPVNAKGQVAFYSTVLRGPGREGIFIADTGETRRVAGFGDPVPSGGVLAELGSPLPTLNAIGHVAFVARLAGGRGTEGVFLKDESGLRAIAMAGEEAPGMPAGVMAGFDAPALNDNDEMAFVAAVRRGRETLDVLYFWNGARLQRVLAEGERLLRTGGTMDKIGGPALNNGGVIAFPAALFKGPALGGIFVAGTRELRLLAGTGDAVSGRGMILRFSERLAVDDDGGVAFGAHLTGVGQSREAILRASVDGLTAVAVEGEAAPGGGRYAGFGPWPTLAPDGAIAFVAALDRAPAPLAVFTGRDSDIHRVAASGGAVGRFAPNTVAVSGPGGTITFATSAQAEGERSTIYCRCRARQH